MEAPKDKYNLIYLALLFNGIIVLLPWNMFITIKSYFVNFKLSEEYTGLKTEYATYFIAYLSFVSQIPTIIFEYLNLFLSFKINLKTIIQHVLLFEIIIFIVHTILAILDTSEYPQIFFYITMVTVFLINMVAGIFQNSLYGISVLFPKKYVESVIIGTNISGILTSAVTVLLIYLTPSYLTLGVLCFSLSVTFSLIMLVINYLLCNNKFYKYHINNVIETNKDKSIKNIFNVASKVKLELFNIFFIFFVTLFCFPTIVSDIKQVDKNFILSEKYFTPIGCFLIFNISTTLGSVIAHYTTFFKNVKILTYCVFIRLLLIPIFLFCNYEPKNTNRDLIVLINNDWLVIILIAILGISSGYLSNFAFQKLLLKEDNNQITGMLGATSLITGIFTGLFTSLIFQNVLICI